MVLPLKHVLAYAHLFYSCYLLFLLHSYTEPKLCTEWYYKSRINKNALAWNNIIGFTIIYHYE